MRRFILILAFVLIGLVSIDLNSAWAQPTANPTQSFLWDQTAPSLSAAQGYTYKYFLDDATTGIAFTGVTCSAGPTTGSFLCKARIPTMSAGTHTISMTTTNANGESARSAVFTFQYVIPVPPPAPSNIRIINS